MILPVHVLITTSKSSSILQILVPMDTEIVTNIKFLQLNTDKSLASTLNILQEDTTNVNLASIAANFLLYVSRNK